MTRLILLIIFFLLMAASILQAQRPDAPQYGQRGTYAVGTREYKLAEETRNLTVTIWYPAEGEPGSEPARDYPVAAGFSVAGHAYLDAPVAEADTPFPLIVLSHGSGASRLLYLWYTEHLASQGFVVLAADHPRNTVIESFLGSMIGSAQDFVGSYALRPDDVLRQIALAESLNKDGDFAGKIDVNNIGVTGHSFGGWTALSAGGAQMDFGSFRQWCDGSPGRMKNGICFLLPMETDIAQARGLESPPEGLWMPTTDARIKAIVPLAPWNAPILNFDGITVPTMILVGTDDRTTIPERDAYVIYDAIHAPKTLVTFDYGSHYLFVDDCPPLLLAFDEFESCSDEVWDMARAHDITNHLTTAFFLAHLKGDETAAEALQAENVDFPAVRYKSE